MALEPVSRFAVARSGLPADRDVVVEVLFRTHYVRLLRLAMLLVGSREEAEEVVQDAFVSLHRRWSGLRDTGSAGAYLRAAVVGGCRSRRRGFARATAATPRMAVILDDPTLENPTAEERAIDAEAAAEVAAAVQELPTRQREVLVARYYLELTEAQTADLLHISLGSVKRHAHRALAALERGMKATS